MWDTIFFSIAAAADIIANNNVQFSFSLPMNHNFLAEENAVALPDKIPFNKSPLPVIYN